MSLSDQQSTIYKDHSGLAIRLTGERREHILEHPEMADQLARLAETLAEPESIVETYADPTVQVYHRLYESTPVTRKNLLVVVKILPDDAYILTAFFSSRVKKGRVIWQR